MFFRIRRWWHQHSPFPGARRRRELTRILMSVYTRERMQQAFNVLQERPLEKFIHKCQRQRKEPPDDTRASITDAT